MSRTVSYVNPWSGATVVRNVDEYTQAHIDAMVQCLSDEQAEEIHDAMPVNATPADWLLAAERILPDDVFASIMAG